MTNGNDRRDAPENPEGLKQPGEPLADLESLLEEFERSFLGSPEGTELVEQLSQARRDALRHYDAVVEVEQRGGLEWRELMARWLPHAPGKTQGDNTWIFPSTPAALETRTWLERPREANTEKGLALAIFRFVQRSVNRPTELPPACVELLGTKGAEELTCGVVSPILSSLQPQAFASVHRDSLRVIHLFSSESLSGGLGNYPAANAAALSLLAKWDVPIASQRDQPPTAMFECFCRWLTHSKKGLLRKRRFGVRPDMYEDWPPMW